MPKNLPSPSLLHLLKSRDPKTLEGLLDDHTEVLLRTAWGLGWVGEAAEDLVQDTFVDFLKATDRFEGRSSLRTYLIGILYHKSQKRRRSKELATDPIDAVFDGHFGLGGIWRVMPRGPEDESLAKETSNLIAECLKRLPTPQRLAFFLKEIEQMKGKDLCNVLKVSETHLRVLLFRARNRLKECVQRRWNARD